MLAHVTRADSFVVPFEATIELSPAGGEAGANTTFGLGTSEQSLTPLFTNLPNNPTPNTPINIGYYPAGSSLDMYLFTSFGSNGYAFSIDTASPASQVAFGDTNNSLGLGGSVYEQTSATTWVFRLDDALSYLFDDDDNDVLIQATLTLVPEPSFSVLLLAAIVVSLRRQRHR
jgi:hypothetical protein